MFQALGEALSPYYLQIKFVHLLAVMIWAWSTAVAYFWYVRAAHLKARRNPEDGELQRRAQWALEKFDDGVVLEHIAFPVILLTGTLLYFAGGWTLSHRWLALKLSIVVLVFVPMEIVDIWLSHFGGQKRRARLSGDQEKYGRLVRLHWQFFRLVTPLVAVGIPFLIYLAVVRP